jgi:hypothetical protein
VAVLGEFRLRSRVSAVARAKIAYMTAVNEDTYYELNVAPDGSIPADQLKRLGVGPGTHLRVVAITVTRLGGSFAGSLPDFPDVTWEDFERANQPSKTCPQGEAPPDLSRHPLAPSALPRSVRMY